MEIFTHLKSMFLYFTDWTEADEVNTILSVGWSVPQLKTDLNLKLCVGKVEYLL